MKKKKEQIPSLHWVAFWLDGSRKVNGRFKMSLENVIRIHDLSNEFDDRQVAVGPVACAVSFPQSENRIPPV